MDLESRRDLARKLRVPEHFQDSNMALPSICPGCLRENHRNGCFLATLTSSHIHQKLRVNKQPLLVNSIPFRCDDMPH